MTFSENLNGRRPGATAPVRSNSASSHGQSVVSAEHGVSQSHRPRTSRSSGGRVWRRLRLERALAVPGFARYDVGQVRPTGCAYERAHRLATRHRIATRPRCESYGRRRDLSGCISPWGRAIVDDTMCLIDACRRPDVTPPSLQPCDTAIRSRDPDNSALIPSRATPRRELAVEVLPQTPHRIPSGCRRAGSASSPAYCRIQYPVACSGSSNSCGA